ncbi:ECF transporter S component [Spelaeicoccus albus]|uniref:Energy-coupling factor transport system substrate-specific component n=1 Tax=Spelaeicoccus albus TaxID=1280376 RepID=A0A7Z0D133_9MICO|nr:ECF transporter S component [Spelaeicoccus albus]NYI66263.1 energy-coupling factor transport system substrate-specific component [Spelaeicoccus albus]
MVTAHVSQTPRAGRFRWRVVDIVIAAVLGVAAGVIFWAWGLAWTPLSNLLVVIAPLSGLLAGVWLFAGVIGGLVVRKPGAAVFTEIVAATVEMAIGSQFGFSNLIWGLAQGLGAEVILLLFLYRKWGVAVAVLAGAASGLVCGLMDTTFTDSAAWSAAWKSLYTACTIVSGAVLGGLLSWVAVRALARTGALNRFAAGRSREAI